MYQNNPTEKEKCFKPMVLEQLGMFMEEETKEQCPFPLTIQNWTQNRAEI